MDDPAGTRPTRPPLPQPLVGPPVDTDLVGQAVRWAREAGDHTLKWFRHPELAVDTKHDGTPVTRADREAEHLLRDRIAAAHPADSLRGEEHEDIVGTSGRTWVIDPIDGTKAFSQGVATYSNLLYLQDEHGPAIGVINLPALGETVWAARGLGCHVDERPVQVRPHDRLEGSYLCVSGFHGISAETFARLASAGVELRTWGDAYGYALVASGRAAAMYDPALAWWDLAAVMVVVREAGGVITRTDGDADVATPHRAEPYPFDALATDGSVHERWVEVLSC